MIGIRIGQALNSSIPDNALRFLTEALAMGKPEGFIRAFVDQGTALVPLLRRTNDKGIEQEYVRKLLSVIEAEGRRREIMKTKRVPVSGSPESLSQRELELLRLVAAGYPTGKLLNSYVSA